MWMNLRENSGNSKGVHWVLLTSLFPSLVCDLDWISNLHAIGFQNFSRISYCLKCPWNPAGVASHPFSSVSLSIFIHLLIQEIFTEHIFCSRHYLKISLRTSQQGSSHVMEKWHYKESHVRYNGFTNKRVAEFTKNEFFKASFIEV